jgi:hypothetical protein
MTIQSEIDHARRRAKKTVVEFVTQNNWADIDFLIHDVGNSSLDESEKDKLTDLLGAIDFLRYDLTKWAQMDK